LSPKADADLKKYNEGLREKDVWFRHSAFYLNRRKKNTDVGNNDKQGTNRSQFPKLWTPNPENSTCQLRKGVAR